MLKLFDNCKEMKFGRSGKFVTGLESDESEKFDLNEPQKPEGAVEIWMKKIDEEMQMTLHKKTKEGTFNYANKERISWVIENLGMIAIVGAQIWWTWRVEDVFRKVREGNKVSNRSD